MRTLAVVACIAVAGCHPGLPWPTYPAIAIPPPIVESKQPVGTLVLVSLNGAGESPAFSKNAAFLSAFCEWIKRTPSVSAKYSSVWLAFNKTRDPISDAYLSLKRLRASLHSDPKDATSDPGHLADAERLMLKLADDTRIEASRCTGNAGVATENASLLAVDHTQVAPYGPGLSYLSLSPLGERHGYMILRGDSLERDIRRFAGVTLATAESAVNATIRLELPPSGECHDLEPTAPERTAPCLYLSHAAKVMVTPVGTPYVDAKDMEVRGWRIEDEHHEVIAASSELATDGLVATNKLRFRRAGTYRITAIIVSKTDPPIQIERSLALELRVPAIVVFDDEATRNRRDADPELQGRSEHVVEITTACRGTWLGCEKQDDRGLEISIQDHLRGVYSAETVKGVLTDLDKQLSAISLRSKTATLAWSRAVPEVLTFETVRDLLERPADVRALPWCVAASEAIRAGLVTSGEDGARDDGFQWEPACEAIVKAAIPQPEAAARYSGYPARIRSDRLVPSPGSARTSSTDEYEVIGGAEPFVVRVENLGGPSRFGASVGAGVLTYSTASGQHTAIRPTARFFLNLTEGLWISAEQVIANDSRWSNVNVEVDPLCHLLSPKSPVMFALCRRAPITLVAGVNLRGHNDAGEPHGRAFRFGANIVVPVVRFAHMAEVNLVGTAAGSRDLWSATLGLGFASSAP